MSAPTRGARPVAAPPSLAGRPAGFVSRLLAISIDVALLALVIMVGNLLLTALRIAGPVPWALGRLARAYPWIGPWLVDAGALLSLTLALATVAGMTMLPSATLLPALLPVLLVQVTVCPATEQPQPFCGLATAPTV